MIEVPAEFIGDPDGFRKFLSKSGGLEGPVPDLKPFRASDVYLEGRSKARIAATLALAEEQTKKKQPQPYVRESSVSFSPRPFAPQPVTTVRWRGIKTCLRPPFAPKSVTLEVILSGTFPSDDVCNNNEDVPLTADTETATRDTSKLCGLDADFGLSSGAGANTVDYGCLNSGCYQDFQLSASCTILFNQTDSHYYMGVSIDPIGPFCFPSASPIGGDILLDFDLGANPNGSHILDIPDPNWPTVSYNVHVNISIT